MDVNQINEVKCSFRALIATDIHLGYAEADSLRGNDTFHTFEEVLQIASENDVDFVILGGDLFHENKPSSKTMTRCMELLRKHCTGDKTIKFQIVSNQKENFNHTQLFPFVNFQDNNLNISIPVFSIHGNHDDPIGRDHLCALESISAAGYINYFGKSLSIDELTLTPILLKKGSAKIALYGLGYIPDERLYRLFTENKVKFSCPANAEDWFKILVVHQNRVKHGKKYLPESFLTEYPDLVIWGHEHESFDHVELTDKYYIYQPGSTVVTSLCPAEARPKHVGLIEIAHNGFKNEFKLSTIKLKTTRKLYFETLDVDTLLADLNGEANSETVFKYCTEKIEDILHRAYINHSGDERQPKEPLIRLRVDCSNEYFTFSPYHFGQQFVNRVANPKEIILFKVKRDRTKKPGSSQETSRFDEVMEIDESIRYNIEDEIKGYFQSIDRKGQLNILCENTLTDTVKLFVEKDASSELISSAINKNYEETLKFLHSDSSLNCEDLNSVANACFEFKEKHKPNSSANVAELLKTTATKAKTKNENDIEFNSCEESGDEGPPSKRQKVACSKRSRGTGRTRGARGSGRNFKCFQPLF